MKKIVFIPEIKKKLKLLAFEISNIQNKKIDQEIWNAIENLASEYKKLYNGFSSAKPLLQTARKLYKSVGIEPSRYRPSSEALLKRILQDKPLYQINAAVDFGNYCSLKYMLPVGLYDMDKIEGDIQVRLGYDDEVYEGLGKPVVYLHDKLVLSDQKGAFGNPSSDSRRTSVDLNTRNLLFVYYLPYDLLLSQIETLQQNTQNDINVFLHAENVNIKLVE